MRVAWCVGDFCPRVEHTICYIHRHSLWCIHWLCLCLIRVQRSSVRVRRIAVRCVYMSHYYVHIHIHMLEALHSCMLYVFFFVKKTPSNSSLSAAPCTPVPSATDYSVSPSCRISLLCLGLNESSRLWQTQAEQTNTHTHQWTIVKYLSVGMDRNCLFQTVILHRMVVLHVDYFAFIRPTIIVGRLHFSAKTLCGRVVWYANTERFAREQWWMPLTCQISEYNLSTFNRLAIYLFIGMPMSTKRECGVVDFHPCVGCCVVLVCLRL